MRKIPVDLIHARSSAQVTAVSVALVVLLVACTNAGSVTPTSEGTNAFESTTRTFATTTTRTPDATTTTIEEARQNVEVVFALANSSDCSGVKHYDRIIGAEAEPIEAAFNLLVAGPNEQETADGAESFFSAQTANTVHTVHLDGGLLTVNFADFSRSMNNASTSCGSSSLIAQLNATAFQFPAVEQVQYEMEADCTRFYGWLQRDCTGYSRP